MLIQDQPLTHGLWLLKDDTEEDLVGSDVHQDVIDGAFEGAWLAGPHQGRRWHVGRQLMLLIPDIGLGRDWHPSPDIMIHPDADPAPLTSFDTRILGMPPLLLEIASEGTVAYDRGAKRNGYFLAGVQEYLVFDPAGEWITAQVEAWRRGDEDEVVPWQAAADGRWHSATVGISFAVEGMLLRVYDTDGRPLPTFREQARLRAAQELEITEQRQALSERQQQLDALQQELAALAERNAELEARLHTDEDE